MAERGDTPVTRGDAPVCRPADSDRTTIYEKSSPGRRAYTLPELGVPEVPAAELVPDALRRSAPARLPEIGEIDLLRHFTGLSTLNYGVDSGSYPLGSCTMKYNPRVNEVAARLDGFSGLHPYQPESLLQGALELMHELERWLAEISGLHATTLQPAAGAHGELTGLLVIRAAHLAEGRDPKRIIIPDTAHGTNPASVVMAGFVPAPVSSDAARRRGHRRAARDHRRGRHRRPHAHQPQHARPVRRAHHRDRPAGARRRRPAVLRRRQRQRRARHQPPRRHGLRHRPLQHAQDVQHAARRRRPRRRPHRGPRLPGAVPAGAAGGEGRGRSLLLPVRPSPVHRQGAHLLRQLRRAGPRLDVHPQPGRGGPARGQRDGGAQRQLRDGGPARAARPALRRPALHARVRGFGDAAQAGRRARPRRGQAPARLRRAPADHVLPAHRRRGAHGRADGDGVQGRARPPDRGVPERGARGEGRSRSCCARRR